MHWIKLFYKQNKNCFTILASFEKPIAKYPFVFWNFLFRENEIVSFFDDHLIISWQLSPSQPSGTLKHPLVIPQSFVVTEDDDDDKVALYTEKSYFIVDDAVAMCFERAS